ncbi:MAG: excinuclease ABC subunit UvrC [Desulfobulbaceae bacterium]|jgi:excinuclease ABC subunit C|nr:excinuclease ABC subunit UvrC [Desulfobulbaceae bacterium]
MSEHTVLTDSFLKDLTTSPGVYLMYDKHRVVIYVGKARNLKQRVTAYARLTGSSHNKTRAMVAKINAIETILTRTEKEALILEASLIKRHKPKYNVILRDDKNYPYIRVSVQDEWPRVMMSRRKNRDKALYFGPYSSISSMWDTLKLLWKLFPLHRCKTVRPRRRPCLNGQMGQCLAPCMGDANRDRYLENLRNVILILEGKSKELIADLKGRMIAASQGMQFEQAGIYRDHINALRKTLEKQIVAGRSDDEIDIFGCKRLRGSLAVSVLSIRGGLLIGNRSFHFPNVIGDDGEVMGEVLERYYLERYIPKLVLIPWALHEGVLVDYLGELKQSRVEVRMPKRGDGRKLTDMAEMNAQQVFIDRDKRKRSWQSLAAQLQETLQLMHKPDRIECLDISNTSGKQPVGSLVCFLEGEKAGSEYRHYRIRSKDTPDDYQMMYEVLKRRFDPEKTHILPELLLLDGGKGQLGIGVQVLAEFGLSDQIDLVGIAKQKDEEGEKLFLPGRKDPVILPGHSPLLLLLMQIRDESHRFGVTLHRKLRQKKTISSILESIPGIGEVKQQALLEYFGSVKRVRSATKNELARVNGFGKRTAEVVYSFLHDK